MLEFKTSVFVLVFNIFSGYSEDVDVAPNIYCNTKPHTWKDSWKECIKARGTPVAYDTGIGLTVREIHLHSEVDVWTSDHALRQSTPQSRLCGFNFLSNDTLFSPIMYGECDVQRYYLCKNNTTDKLEVHKSKRDDVICPYIISQHDLKNSAQDIKPGYYWTSGKENVSIDKVTDLPNSLPFLCGAYSADKDKYFDNCSILKSSLCNISNRTYLQSDFNKSCFVNDIAESTANPVHIGTSTSKKTVTANKMTTAMNRKENDSNFGVTVGVPVGLGVAVLFGIVLVIFMLRRYKCLKSRRRQHGSKEEVWEENAQSPKQENASVMRFLKDKTTSDTPKQSSDQPPQNSFPEYAVVRKKNPKIFSQGQNKNSTSEENTVEHFQNHIHGENSSNCYAGDFDNKNEDQPEDGDEDYDVTSNVKHFKTQNDTYNTLQMEEYGSSHYQRRGDDTYNMLNMPNDQSQLNDYDTANRRDHNVGTNNIYNRLC